MGGRQLTGWDTGSFLRDDEPECPGSAFKLIARGVSSAGIHRPRLVVRTTGGSRTPEPCGELVTGRDICIDRHYESEEGRARLEVVLADRETMNKILARLPW